jgi:hypothetical protein
MRLMEPGYRLGKLRQYLLLNEAALELARLTRSGSSLMITGGDKGGWDGG